MVYGRYSYSQWGLKLFINQLITGGAHPVGYMMVYVYMEVSINGVTSKASLGEWQLEVIYLGIPRNGQSPSSLDGLFHGKFENTWLVVWNIFDFPIYWEYSSQLTIIFQRGWNHQPDKMDDEKIWKGVPPF